MPQKPIKFQLFDQEWQLLFKRLRNKKQGWCILPERQLQVHSGLTEKRRLRVIIHEFLHAADWSKDEDWTWAASEYLADLLYDELGYTQEDGR